MRLTGYLRSRRGWEVRRTSRAEIGPDRVASDEDITSEPGIAYLSAPTLKMATGKSPRRMGSRRDTAEMRHGLSIRYDPKNDQVIASYPSSHRLMIFDGSSGDVLQSFDTRKNGPAISLWDNPAA